VDLAVDLLGGRAFFKQQQRTQGGRMATNPRHAERETAQAEDVTRRTTEQMAQVSRTAAAEGERTTRASSEATLHNVEKLSQTWQSGSEAASRIVGRSVDQLSKMLGLSGETARRAAQQSSGNLQAIVEGSSIIADGFSNVSGEWIRFTQNWVEQNLENLDHLRECRTLQDCMTLQTQMVRENLEAVLHSTRRTSELAAKMADEAIRRIGEPSIAPR
jgi:phasin family protein